MNEAGPELAGEQWGVRLQTETLCEHGAEICLACREPKRGKLYFPSAATAQTPALFFGIGVLDGDPPPCFLWVSKHQHGDTFR